jgi:hypothetical protein
VAATAEERQMIDHTTRAPVLPGDFAAGERTDLPTPDEAREEALQGDFAAGERTAIPTPEEQLEESLHGDFAAGHRSEPLTPEDDPAGTFADSADGTA